MKESFIRYSLKLFSIGCSVLIVISVFAAAAVLLSLAAGGDTAQRIIRFILDYCFPILFICNVALCVVGLLHNYAVGDRSFRFEPHGRD